MHRSIQAAIVVVWAGMGGGAALGEELTCPTPEHAAGIPFPDVRAPIPKEWYATRYRVEPPKLTADSKLVFDELYLNPNFVQCKYKVETGGVVRVQLSRQCEKARGPWADQGENRKCAAPAVSDCVVACK